MSTPEDFGGTPPLCGGLLVVKIAPGHYRSYLLRMVVLHSALQYITLDYYISVPSGHGLVQNNNIIVHVRRFHYGRTLANLALLFCHTRERRKPYHKLAFISLVSRRLETYILQFPHQPYP
jgi:hypothetical protein